MSLFQGLAQGNMRGPSSSINEGSSLLGDLGKRIRFPTTKINEDGGSLFGNVRPYTEPKKGPMHADTDTYGTALRIQKIVPEILLPTAEGSIEDYVKISHPIQSGDIVFVIRTSSKEALKKLAPNARYYERNNLGRAVDPLCNLATVNYILRCLSTNQGSDRNAVWENWLQAVTGGKLEKANFEEYTDESMRSSIDLISKYIVPLGIAIGSDLQGGQLQGRPGPVDWPVDYVSVIICDGLCETIPSIWSNCAGLDVNAGDDLGLALIPVPDSKPSSSVTIREITKVQFPHVPWANPVDLYVLNSWESSLITQTVSLNGSSTNQKSWCAQLVPYSSGEFSPLSGVYNKWHICKTQVAMPKKKIEKGQCVVHMRDNTNKRNGPFLEANICPWFEGSMYYPKGYEYVNSGGTTIIKFTIGQNVSSAFSQENELLHETSPEMQSGEKDDAASSFLVGEHAYTASHDVRMGSVPNGKEAAKSSAADTTDDSMFASVDKPVSRPQLDSAYVDTSTSQAANATSVGLPGEPEVITQMKVSTSTLGKKVNRVRKTVSLKVPDVNDGSNE